MKRKVCVIGGGPSGLISAKTLIDFKFAPIIFEKEDNIDGLGGVWGDNGLAWEGMRCNLSCHTCCFSCLPWDDIDHDEFPTKNQMKKYLHTFAIQFNLLEIIRFNSQVVNVERIEGGEEEGYIVTIREGEMESQELFEFVVVCCGFFMTPLLPSSLPPIPSHISQHTLQSLPKDLRSDFGGEGVAVVGSSFSGGELISELKEIGSSPLLLFPSPSPRYYLPRTIYSPKDRCEIPIDLMFYSRSSLHPSGVPPINIEASHKFLSSISPIYPPTSLPSSSSPPQVAISDSFPNLIKSGGGVEVANPISSSSVIPESIQHLIFCTGFGCDLSFLSSSLLSLLQYAPSDSTLPFLAFEHTLVPNLPTFGLVGVYRGQYFLSIELQATLLCLHFLSPFPDHLIQSGLERLQEMRNSSDKPQFPEDYVHFSERLGKLCGLSPVLEELEDEELKRMVEKGPFLPQHYQLSGHHKEEAIKTIKRVNWEMSWRKRRRCRWLIGRSVTLFVMINFVLKWLYKFVLLLCVFDFILYQFHHLLFILGIII